MDKTESVADTTDHNIAMVRKATTKTNAWASTADSNARSVTSDILIGPGECFGSFRGRTASDSDGQMMLCKINEPKTVILKLSATSFNRIVKVSFQFKHETNHSLNENEFIRVTFRSVYMKISFFFIFICFVSSVFYFFSPTFFWKFQS